MGSSSELLTMRTWAFLCLVSLLSSGLEGASLSYQQGSDFSFAQNGIQVDLSLKDKVNPLVGGKAHVELPIGEIWKVLETGNALLKPLETYLETLNLGKLYEVYIKPIVVYIEGTTFGKVFNVDIKPLVDYLRKTVLVKLYDINLVKADVTYNADKILEGVVNVVIDTTLVYKDGTQETATFTFQCNMDGGIVSAKMQVTSASNSFFQEQIKLPVTVSVTCNLYDTHSVTIATPSSKIAVKISNSMDAVTVKGVVEYLGQQHKISSALSIKEKAVKISWESPSGDITSLNMNIATVNGYPKLIFTGSLPNTFLTTSGEFKTEVIMHNLFQYTVKHIHNSQEMLKVKLSLATTGLVDCTILFGAGLKYNTKITVTYLNGFPKMVINGNVPSTFLFNAGKFESQLVMHHLLHYSVKHVHNGEEMLKVKVIAAKGKLLECSVLFGTGLKYNTNVIVDHVNGFPKMVILGKLPYIFMQSVAEFKTEVLMHNLFHYSLSHVFNGQELLKVKATVSQGKILECTVLFGHSLKYNTVVTVNYVNGFPKMIVTGKIPNIIMFTEAEFKTELVMKNIFHYTFNQAYNGQEIIKVETTLASSNILECSVLFGKGLTYNTHVVVKTVGGFPKLTITGKIPNIFLMKVATIETELTMHNLFEYSGRFAYNAEEVFKLKATVAKGKLVECTVLFGKGLTYNTKIMIDHLNGFPKIAVTGKIPTVLLTSTAEFSTELIMHNLFLYSASHQFNGQKILDVTANVAKAKLVEFTAQFGFGLKHNVHLEVEYVNGFPKMVVTGQMPLVQFETMLIMHNLYQYSVKHIFHGQEIFNTKVVIGAGKLIECTMLFGKGLKYNTNLIVSHNNGLPQLIFTGQMPLATFKTEFIMPNLKECTLMHILNGQEILNLKVVATKGKVLECTILFGKGLKYNTHLVVDHVNGFPHIMVTGKIPMVAFETSIIMHSLHKYSVKQIFNGQEILKTTLSVAQSKFLECSVQFGIGLTYNTHLMVELTNGFPKMVITGKVPMIEFTTKFIMENANQFALHQTLNGQQIFKANIIVAKEKFLECTMLFGFGTKYNTFLTLDFVNGFPKMVITGRLPMVEFETIVYMESFNQYSIKHLFNGQTILKSDVVVAKEKFLDFNILFGTGLQYKTQWTVDYVNGFPKMTITGNVPMANFATYVTMHNLHEYTMTHVFNGQEVFNTIAVVAKGQILECTMLFGMGLKYNTHLTLDYVNGLPKFVVAGNWPIVAFETELAMNSFNDYSIKHIFNGFEIFNTKVTIAKGKLFECTMLFGIDLKYNTQVMVEYVSGLPKIVIAGKLPMVTFETNMIMENIHQFIINNVVNGQELVKTMVTIAKEKLFECNMMFGIGLKYNALVTLEYVNGFPKMVITAKLPIVEFETDLIMYNFNEYAFKHVINGLEIFNTKVVVAKEKLLDFTIHFGLLEYNYHFIIDYVNGFPKVMITGKMPLVTFEAEVVMQNVYQYNVKTVLNAQEVFNAKVAIAQGKLVDCTVAFGIGLKYKTNLIVEQVNGFPKVAISGTVPMVTFNTEIAMLNLYQYTLKHVFNGETLFNAKLSVAQAKLLDCVVEFGFGLKYNTHLLMDYVNGLPKIMVTGNLPLIKFTTELTMKNIFHWSLSHVVNGWEMFNVDVTLAEGSLLECIVLVSKKQVLHFKVEYANNTVKLIFPETNFWLLDHKDFEVEWAFIPTNAANLWQGGNVKFAVLRKDTTLLKIGGLINLTFNSDMIHIVLNNWTFKIVQPTLMKLMPVTALQGEVLVNLKTMKWLPKVTFDMKLQKETSKVVHIIFSTNETPFKLHFYCPLLTNTILNIQNLEYVKVEMTPVVKGNEIITTVVCNLTTKTIIVKITPTLITFEIMDGTISLIKFINELNAVKESDKKYLIDGKTGIQLDKASVVYKTLCKYTPVCFNDLTKKVHLNVQDLLAGKLAFVTAVTKDATEIYHVEVNTVATPKKIMVKIPFLKFETTVQFDLTSPTCIWTVNLMKWQNMLMIKPTAEGSFDILLNGTPIMKLQRIDTKISLVVAEIPIMELERLDKTVKILLLQTPILNLELSDNGVTFVVKDVKIVKIELLTKKMRITSMVQNIPAISAIITYRTLSIFDNTIGVEVTVGQMSNKVLFAWNINQPMKAFVDLKILGKAIIVGNYELTHHVNWNIKGVHFIDLAWNGKILCTGIKYLATPVVTDGTAVVKDFVVDLKEVVMYNNQPYTTIFKTNPLKIALLPFFQYP